MLSPVSIQRRLHLAIAALVALQLCSWPLAMLTATRTGVDHMSAAVAAYALIAVVTVALLLRGPGGAAGSGPASVAVAAGAVALFAGGRATTAGFGTGYSHPSLAVAVGLALLLALASNWTRAAVAAAVFVAAYLLGVWDTLAIGRISITGAATNVATLAVVPLAGRWVAGTLIDLSASRAAQADSAEQVRRVAARETERTKQYRRLHDTVLSSLGALSRGSLDPRDPAVAQRLAGDADYLRGLIATSASGAGMFLVGELARITREHAATGLRVHQQISEVPDEIPLEVLRALADGVNEALTNVVKHSGRPEAWVTIVGSEPVAGEGVVVTVTDQGAGFDSDLPQGGFGISGSLIARMTDVGGDAVVDSAPGQGTSVELRWPR